MAAGRRLRGEVKALVWIVGAALVSGCGGSDSSDGPGGSGGAAGSGGSDGGTLTDGGWPVDGAAGSAGGTGDAGPTTVQYDPCATGTCYTARSLGSCGTTTVNDDYASGLYNVHHFLLMAPAGVEVLLTATRTAGSWSPLLIVHDEQGNTVYDGTDTHSTNALTVSPLPAPGSPDTVGVSLTAATRMHLGVYLSGSEAVSAGSFTGSLPTDAKYTLEANLDCTAPAGLTVRGVKLSARQELWVRYIGEHVVPLVPGTAAERIDKSAYVAWWALKEGVLDTNNPLSYSNCSIPPDKHIGPVEVCPNPKNAWQVGISGVQATYTTPATATALASTITPARRCRRC